MDIGVPQEVGPGEPYLATGRSAQKRRTRDALVAAARGELAAGRAVTVESAAAAAGISRTTAYRYFRDHRALVAAAHPQVEAASLLPDPAPEDPGQRLSVVVRAFLEQVTVPWEPQLRAALHLALAPGQGAGAPGASGAPDSAPGADGAAATTAVDGRGAPPGARDAGTLRQGRAVGWFLEALAPLAATHPGLDLPLLARAVRSAAGIEALVWLTDVGGLPRPQAVEVMHASAMAVLADALRAGTWPPQGPPEGRGAGEAPGGGRVSAPAGPAALVTAPAPGLRWA